MNQLSVLTPTFQSLCSQISKNFEWWIVDDGSTDNTQEAVQTFCRKADFPIHYIHKSNGGKHTTFNAATGSETIRASISGWFRAGSAVQAVFSKATGGNGVFYQSFRGNRNRHRNHHLGKI